MEELNNSRIHLSDIKQEKEEKMEIMECELVPSVWENSATAPLQPVKVENINDSNDSMEWENSTESPQETLEMETETIEQEIDSGLNLEEGIELPQEALPNHRSSISVDQSISSSNIRDDDMLLDHVLLPRILLHNTPEELLKTESNIISQMVRIADDWTSKWLSSKTAELLRGLKNFYLGCSPQTVHKTINNLCPGDNFAVFVRAQHCAILIHVPVESNANDVIVATFPGILKPSEIYSRESGIEVKPFYFLYQK